MHVATGLLLVATVAAVIVVVLHQASGPWVW